jgi:long-chain acyl-CoA synthetase
VEHPWDRRLGFWHLAQEFPDHPAILEGPNGEHLTMAELAGDAHQLARALRAKGLRPGDITAYLLPNSVAMVRWQLACEESGLRYVALNPALAAAEVRQILELAEVTALLVDASLAELALNLADVGSLEVRLATGGAVPGFEDLDAAVAPFERGELDDRVLGGSISYSSGTTGRPKGIERPRLALDPYDEADKSAVFARAFQIKPLEGCHLASAGMHHGGCQTFYRGALNVGQPLVILGRFDPEATLAAIERNEVTSAYMVPTQFIRLLKLPDEVKARYDVSSLEVVAHAAAPCPVEVKRQLMAWWGPVIWETYGGMEGAATIAKPQRWLERPGTVGRAIAGMAIRILDDDGNELPAGEVGHVYLEPDQPTFEYRNDPELTASIHRGKAFTLGDMGYVDADGYLFLSDRAKDMIIAGGINIYPAEIEGVLHQHPAVLDVGVIGVPNDEWGEEVKAVVQLMPGVEPSSALADELIAFCQERLARFKCPRSVDFAEELPRTDQGKLLKRRLREPYWKDAERSI